jgi:hypothetical protein
MGMDESDLETDPRRKVPTLAWVMLGLVILLLFVAGVAWVGRPHPTRAIGPPAGAPPDQSVAPPPAPSPAPIPH